MKGFTYILTTINNTTLYTGVTSDLRERLKKHRENYYSDSFTRKYNVKKLVYYEIFETMDLAIKREKQIKSGSRKKKVGLIESMNPDWKDLSDILPD
jgi:putative endonuclease